MCWAGVETGVCLISVDSALETVQTATVMVLREIRRIGQSFVVLELILADNGAHPVAR